MEVFSIHSLALSPSKPVPATCYSRLFISSLHVVCSVLNLRQTYFYFRPLHSWFFLTENFFLQEDTWVISSSPSHISSKATVSLKSALITLPFNCFYYYSLIHLLSLVVCLSLSQETSCHVGKAHMVKKRG